MIDPARLLDTFLAILRIDSYHPNEDPVVDALRPKLLRAGVSLQADQHRNVLGYWPGTGAKADREPVLLCAHTDTVRPTPGMEPVVRDGAVHTDGSSVLGADDKAAVAAIVEAVEAIAAEGVAHPPVELLFTVGEDVGHIGSKAFDVAPLHSRRRGGAARPGGDPRGRAGTAARHLRRHQRRQRVQRQGVAHGGHLGRLPRHPHQPGIDAPRRTRTPDPRVPRPDARPLTHGSAGSPGCIAARPR